MLLTDEEIMDINQNAEFDSAIGFARAIESAVLAKLKAQEPMCWMTPSGEGWMMRTEPPTIDTKLGWTALYEHPLPPDDVVQEPALVRYNKHMAGESEPDPVERLRFFLSLALTGQNWLDVEKFLDDLPPDDVVQEPDKTKIECVTGAIYKYISGELYPREVIAAAQYIVHRYCTTSDDVVQKYEELLYAVHRKFPDETRHQTALRYIKTAESPSYTNAAMEKMK